MVKRPTAFCNLSIQTEQRHLSHCQMDAWDVCVNADHAGTDALTTVADSVSMEPISAMVLVKKKS